jgi:hypothetical protein
MGPVTGQLPLQSCMAAALQHDGTDCCKKITKTLVSATISVFLGR